GPESHIRNGESCRVCKDWMKQVGAKIVKGKVIAPKPKPVKVTKVREPKPRPRTYTTRNEVRCGTHQGYDKHRRRGETPCQPCRDAHNARQREYNKRRALERNANGTNKIRSKYNNEYPPIPEELHGTMKGVGRHKHRREELCDPCKEAQATYARSRYTATPKELTPIEHGTSVGYRKEVRRGIPTCQPCKDAEARYRAERKQKKEN